MEKSGFPYLVDISVGNYCTFGCPFCYTSSTEKGKYADGNNLSKLADVLYEAKVFNVVFGGGEPTLYKDAYTNFQSVLLKYASKRFVIGVTTKNYSYHKKDTFKDETKLINSLAVSCQTIEDLEKVSKLNEALPYECKLYIQTILGSTSQKDFELFFKKAQELGFYRITLLGYKDFGFGTTYKKYPITDDWIDFVKSCGSINVGIDSILANNYRDKLIERGVKSYTLVGKEGLNTCYIDALKMVVKPSSFCNEEYPILTNKKSIYSYTGKDFLETFAKF